MRGSADEHQHIMAGMYSPEKEPIGALVSRQLAYRAKKEAKKQGKDLSVFLIEMLEDRVGRVQLTSQDYEQIAKAVREAEITRRRIATVIADH